MELGRVLGRQRTTHTRIAVSCSNITCTHENEGIVEFMTKNVSAVDGRYSARRPMFFPEVLVMLDSVEQCCANATVQVGLHTQLRGPRRGA